MQYILAFILFTLAVLLWRTNGRDQYHFMAILQSALAVVVFWMIGLDLESENGILFSGLLTGLLLSHNLLSRFWKKKSFFWVPLFVLISSGSFFLFQEEFIFSSFSVHLTQPEIILLPLLGALIEPIANTKEKILGDYFSIDYKSRRGISRGAFVFVVGFCGMYFLLKKIVIFDRCRKCFKLTLQRPLSWYLCRYEATSGVSLELVIGWQSAEDVERRLNPSVGKSNFFMAGR